ncbi:hypothetical protein DM02DRAFT_663893 [Periconia macrospinosa]|uniref:Uncharacterized protein n=1 Tax=Periconia macrospinosa TaxID=97972 RepID=A0A2V1D0G7_9PLEO|nr:hypothetical protein DM02DRAFT_663893 [Periconia macrospinosa]
MSQAISVQIRVIDQEALDTAQSQGAEPTGDVELMTPPNFYQDRNNVESSVASDLPAPTPGLSAPIIVRSVDPGRRNRDDDSKSFPLPSSRERSRGRRRGRALSSASGAAAAISSATAWKDLTVAAVRRALLQVPDEQVDQILCILQRRQAAISRLRAREEDTRWGTWERYSEEEL